MVTSQVSLETIDGLLNEFYHTSTNHRKQELESKLIEFQNSENVWKQCLESIYQQHFVQPMNDYLWFFCLSTIEIKICRHWNALTTDERKHLRDCLWARYAMIKDSEARVKREKLAQLIALMGKREFPNEDPSYMENISTFLNTKFVLGILLLRSTSDEIVSTKDDISSEHKEYFQMCVSECMSSIFNILSSYLEKCSERMISLDNQQNNNNNIKSIQSNEDDEHFCNSTIELLNCIQHLFTWVSVEELVTEKFITQLFNLSIWRDISFYSTPTLILNSQNNISICALPTITEILYRQQALPFPNTILAGIKNLLRIVNVKKCSENYHDPMTELLRVFTVKYWEQLAIDKDIFFQIVAELKIYTVNAITPSDFSRKLAIWDPILRGLSKSSFSGYMEIMQSLISFIIGRMLFKNDKKKDIVNILDDIPNDFFCDDSDWQLFLSQCIKTLVLIAEGRLNFVFEQFYLHWRRVITIFCSPQTISMQYDDVPWMFYDIVTIAKIYANLAPLLAGCVEILPLHITELMESLLNIETYLADVIDHTVLQSKYEYAAVYAEILSTIRCFLIVPRTFPDDEKLYLLIYHSSRILHSKPRYQYTLVPGECTQINHLCKLKTFVNLAAVQLLLKIARMRPMFMFKNVQILEFVEYGNKLPHLNEEMIMYLQQTIISCLVLPIVDAQIHQLERNTYLQRYIGNISDEVIQLNLEYFDRNNSDQQQILIQHITTILPKLKNVLNAFSENGSTVKNMLATSFKSITEKSLAIYPIVCDVFQLFEVTDCILDFALSLVKTLQIQLGVTYVQAILSLFLESNKHQLTPYTLKSTEKLLQMMLLVVKQPSVPSSELLPPTFKYSLEIVPNLIENTQLDIGDIILALYELYDGILQHRWQYFFKSQISRAFSPAANNHHQSNNNNNNSINNNNNNINHHNNSINSERNSLDDEPQNAYELSLILTSYGKAFVNGNDPNVIRTILTSLQQLNERWKLFSRDFFKRNLLKSFHTAIINALISQMGALYYDLLLNLLFAMGSVNNTVLHETFIELGYPRDSTVIRDICLAVDLPTFSTKMSQLIKDTRIRQFSNF